MEVNNGGLCQFFVNSSREFAPDLSAALDAIGALEHKKYMMILSGKIISM